MTQSSLQPVALVTGAAQGIGRGIALRLAGAGYAVALADLNGAGLAAVQAEIEAAGGAALSLTADLYQLDQVQQVVDRAAAWGRLQVLVNNAGRVITQPFFDVTEADWDAVHDLDLKAAFFALQYAARRMLADQTPGRIVNIASISGRSGRPDQAAYAGAKAGLISVTRSAALALAPHGITVNAVAPGIVDTPVTRRVHEARAQALGITPEESLARMLTRVPLGRIETPDDVAGVVAFLCSPEAGYITGQTLNVCGGMEMD
jgi:NAD(P)-dependent dehydrogenase (short-subunit alcohol dehydrogenase family)